MEVLSRSLNKLLESQNFKCFSVPRGCPKITHLSYADDVIIFLRAHPSSLRCVMQTIGWYEKVSSQQINVQKSDFLVHDKLPAHCVAKVRRATGFVVKAFPIRYLGFPLFAGRQKSGYVMELVQLVINKVSAWRARCLLLEAAFFSLNMSYQRSRSIC
ncbi:uncharacterized protein [Coffea arabica]|uniref:Reverse transcriptase domain-containing protein n=1 Tax=Coffea arabica TaxID=13443 RepID=A0ABM4VGR1_COFAR